VQRAAATLDRVMVTPISACVRTPIRRSCGHLIGIRSRAYLATDGARRLSLLGPRRVIQKIGSVTAPGSWLYRHKDDARNFVVSQVEPLFAESPVVRAKLGAA
jgi:hypothetical protein